MTVTLGAHHPPHCPVRAPRPVLTNTLSVCGGRLPEQLSVPSIRLPATRVPRPPDFSVTGPVIVEPSSATGPELLIVTAPRTVVCSSETVPAPVAVTAARRVAPAA